MVGPIAHIGVAWNFARLQASISRLSSAVWRISERGSAGC